MATTDKNDNIKEESATAAEQAKASSGALLLHGNIEIDQSKELPEYNNGYIKAYAATANGKSCYAMLCDPRLTPRVEQARNYKDIANPLTPNLIAHGATRLSSGEPGEYAFVYENNLGQRIYKPDDIVALSWKAEKVLQKIIVPIIGLLKDLQARNLTHGNIRAANLYNGDKKDPDFFKLGECLSLPPSMAQPVVYETIERAMADPISRGESTIEDDLYSLGVLVAMHMRSYDPLRGKTDNEILSAKVVNGSYSALVSGNDRFSGGILELIRGLLIDDKRQRWSLEDVSAWLDGRRLSPKQQTKKRKASRAVSIAGTSYYYASTLAHNMVQNQQEAVHIIENNELMHWVERSLTDEEMAHRLESAIKGASDGGTGVGYWDRLLPRVSIALDPAAPIRYKGLSLSPNGIGMALAEAFIQKRGLSTFSNLFMDNIFTFWLTVCTDLNIDVAIHSARLDKCRGFLKQNGLSGGIERCLYFLNDSVHCLSPLVMRYMARTPEDFMNAIEDIAEKSPETLPVKLLDKHAACFLAAKEARLIEPYTYDLSSDENFRNILGMTQALAATQRLHNVGKLPHLTKWLVSVMDPVIERFHSAKMRKKIRSELTSKQNSGDIADLLHTIENPERIREDQMEFRRALRDYRALETERADLERKLKNPKSNAERSGREWAATISGIVAGLIILGFIMVHFGAERPF